MNEPRPQVPELSDGEQELGGESACQLDRVCAHCGALPDAGVPAVCERCGTPPER